MPTSSSPSATEVASTDATVGAGVPVVFTGPNHLASTYIQFLGGDVVGTYNDRDGKLNQPLQSYVAYPLQKLASATPIAPNLPRGVPAVLLNSFSGRLYISIGRGLTGMVRTYIPAAQAPGDPNYKVRYQYIEPTVSGPQINIDLSYIDFTSISLCMTTVNAPHAQDSPQNSQSSLRMATAAGDAASPQNASVLPDPADQLPAAAFARVISPQLALTSVYHDFTHYLQTTLANQTVRVAGTFDGTGRQPTSDPNTQAQSYDFTVRFDSAGNVAMTPKKDSGNGYAPGVPHGARGPGVGDKTTITLKFSDLNASTGIYGCNPAYSLSSGGSFPGITNDVWGEVVGDLLAGLNLGFVGSKTTFGGIPIGNLASTQWWGGIMPDGTVIAPNATPGGQKKYFSGAQSSPLDYNSYAGALSGLTSGYGFPLQDRLGGNLLAMNTATDPGSYVIVWIDLHKPPAADQALPQT